MSLATKAFSHFRRSLSGVGIALGTLFFAAALTPSLIPRTYVMQGIHRRIVALAMALSGIA